MPMQMTSHYPQLFASQQIDLLLLPPFNKILARIQQWCNYWCMILNPKKTKALVVSRQRTVNPPHGDLPMSRVSIYANPNLDILSVKFDSQLIFEDYVRGIVSRVCQRIGILRLVKRVFVDTSVSLRCYYAFVLQMLEYCSPVWGSAAECHLQLLERQVYSVTRLCLIIVSCHCVIDVMLLNVACCARLIRTRIFVCLAASICFNQRSHIRAAAAAHPFEFEVSRFRTSLFARCS